MAEYDAILVPGGGVRQDGKLLLWVRRRLDRARAIHRNQYILPLSAGTVHKPPVLDADGFPIFESVAAGRYLVHHGIAPHYILPETCSYDTIGNAYFSRVIHVDPRGFRHLLVITSAFHMPRTEAIFRWVYGLSPSRCTLSFEEVPDDGIDPVVLADRRRREQESLARLRSTMPRITTIGQLHLWLFTEHQAYGLRRPRSDAGSAICTY